VVQGKAWAVLAIGSCWTDYHYDRDAAANWACDADHVHSVKSNPLEVGSASQVVPILGVLEMCDDSPIQVLEVVAMHDDSQFQVLVAMETQS
jgi:hypothetical protein